MRETCLEEPFVLKDDPRVLNILQYTRLEPAFHGIADYVVGRVPALRVEKHTGIKDSLIGKPLGVDSIHENLPEFPSFVVIF